ncbi:MAG: protein kinase [Oscillospiraceae bacterium]|nr:protein kinase [Oscillospiraceae bacterium]
MNKSYAKEFLKAQEKTAAYEEFELPQEILNRFQIIEQVNRNDYRETLLLQDRVSDELFILKRYHDSMHMGNHSNETELLRGLEHKGLPRFEASIKDDNAQLIIHKYVDGIPLDEFLAERGLINPEKTIEIISAICDVLIFLHSQPEPIIHRDIKPSNIIINPDNNAVTLIDFGISRKYSENAENDTLHLGTQKFAPPEQYGFAQTDCRTDIYALGVVMRYCLTGTTDRSSRIKDISLERIAMKCTALAPESRFQSASALKRALNNYKNRVLRRIIGCTASLLVLCSAITLALAVREYIGTSDVPLVEPPPTVSSSAESSEIVNPPPATSTEPVISKAFSVEPEPQSVETDSAETLPAEPTPTEPPPVQPLPDQPPLPSQPPQTEPSIVEVIREFKTPDGYDEHDYQSIISFFTQNDNLKILENLGWDLNNPNTWSTNGQDPFTFRYGNIQWSNSTPRKITEITLYVFHLQGELDLSGFTELDYLWISNNNFTNINLSGCTKLRVLLASECNLSNINLSHNPNLEHISLWGNNISSIDLSKNIKLKQIEFGCNRLTGISSFDNLPELCYVDVWGNNLDLNSTAVKTSIEVITATVERNKQNGLVIDTNSCVFPHEFRY